MSEQAVIEQPAAAQPSEAIELALIDLSSVAYPIWHMSGAQPDPDYTSQQIVSRIRSLAANHPKAAICCDSGKSFRHELEPTYKAQREAAPQALHHQITLAREQLAADGFPVWSVKGFEADDLIATATALALGMPDVSVLVLSGDKDLLQLVGPRVRAMSVANGNVYDEAAVLAKFGVHPAQIRDYLTLAGDASDNIKGAKGIGGVRAAALLKRFQSLEGVYAALEVPDLDLQASIKASLIEFKDRWEATRALVTLRTDAEIPFIEIDNERRPADLAPMDTEESMSEVAEQPAAAAQPEPAPAEKAAIVEGLKQQAVIGQVVSPQLQAQALAVREPDVLAPAPAEFERQLEPRSLPQAMNLAVRMHEARMFNGYGSPAAVLSTILAGRELGLQAIASLRGFHVIEGKHALAADAMRGLVLRSGQAKYFRVIERTAQRATFETLRVGEPEPVRLTYTIEEGRAAFGFGTDANEKAAAEREAKWSKSAWTKHAPDMLAARASSKLARLVYSDILFGLYAPEELRD